MKKIKNNSLYSILICIGLLSSLTAQAASSDSYIGVSYGTTSVDSGVSNTTGTASVDEEDSGFKIMFGKKINKSFSIEGFYADFGEASLSGNTGDNFDLYGTTFVFTTDNAKISQSATGFGINAKLSHDINKSSSVYGRFGLLLWDADLTASGANITTSSASADGTDVFYGLGYQYNFDNQVALSIDYDMYSADELDFDMLAVGVIYNF